MFQLIKKTKFNLWILITGFVILAMLMSLAPAQPVLAQVVSPQVGEDGTVTFRYEDPNAELVQLSIEHGRNDLGAMCYGSVPGHDGWPIYDMVMDDDGVWSFSLQLDPNIYNYRFVVDGANVIDPMNPTWHPDANNGQVYVPGPDYEWAAIQDVPHGQLQEVFYFSTATGTERPLTVYTPPGYDKDNRTLPTLYLSHGAGGNHIDWSTQGVANNILDNLLAQHKIRPMVVVMTNFYGIPDGSDGYRLDLINSVIPAVEEMFRVNENPEQRAFAGLSAGGLRASNILINSPEEFGFIGIWSGGGLTTENLEPNLAKIQEMRAIDFSVGMQDFVWGFWSYPSLQALNSHDIPYTGIITEGDCHTWYFWRDALHQFLTDTLFKVN